MTTEPQMREQFKREFWRINYPQIEYNGASAVFDAGAAQVARIWFEKGHQIATEQMNARLIAASERNLDIYAQKDLAVAEVREQMKPLVEALTPSAATKAAYIGEFFFFERYMTTGGNEINQKYIVPWTTIKEIMAAIRQRAALATIEQQEKKNG